jgi:hypothetical protein
MENFACMPCMLILFSKFPFAVSVRMKSCVWNSILRRILRSVVDAVSMKKTRKFFYFVMLVLVHFVEHVSLPVMEEASKEENKWSCSPTRTTSGHVHFANHLPH